MLIKQSVLRGIVDGSITIQFRCWKHPTVRSGGTLLTSVGQLEVESVDPVSLDAITDAEARAAGYASVSSLRSALRPRGSGQVYRIRISYNGPDPRVELRARVPAEDELREVLDRLRRLDARAKSGAWTVATLQNIRERPGELAANLARLRASDPTSFKASVRKLKALGLTESLKVGYRLSPRGHAVLRAAESQME